MIRRTIAALLVLLVALAGSACSAPVQQEMTSEETVAFDMANTYFAWALASLGKEFFVEYETEVQETINGDPCYCFTAKTQEETLCYAAVVYHGQRMYVRFTPEAPWQEVTREVWDVIDQSYPS